MTSAGLRAAAAALLLIGWLAANHETRGLVEGPPRWLSAHTLATLRGYAAWGVGPTLGANVILPRSAEAAPASDHTPGAPAHGPALRSLGKLEGAYLSYPSLWSVLVFGVWQVLGSPPPEAFLAALGQVVVGLGGALALFELAWACLALVAPQRLPPAGAALAALAAGLAWVTSPPILYYGRYEVFTDALVLPACLLAAAVATRARFRLAGLGPWRGLALAGAGLLAWGTEWLGWLTMGVIGVGFAWRGRDAGRGGALLRAAWPLWAPMGLAVGLYAAQLGWFSAGWSDMLATFAQRGPGRTLDNGVALTGSLVAGVLASHLAAAAPGGLREGLGAWGQTLLGEAVAGPGAVVVLLGTASLAVVGWRLRTHVKDRGAWGWALAAVGLPPVLHMALLLQHACVHRFAALRWVALLAVLLVALPLAAALGRGQGRWPRALTGVVLALGAGWLWLARPAMAAFAPPGNPLPAAIATLLAAHVGPREVALSWDLAFDGMHPEPLWLANRLVHTPPQLRRLLPKLDPGTVAGMTPVLLAWAEGPSRHVWGPLPPGARWEELPTPVLGRRVVLARLKGQTGRLDAWLPAETPPGTATPTGGLQ
ncbi:MAG: hypothetical protein VKS61_06260 [Candidatus Sericytochromatia bacterium]|nr:hypothetical protein [Candidatus Sericytochromatia bacterium]